MTTDELTDDEWVLLQNVRAEAEAHEASDWICAPWISARGNLPSVHRVGHALGQLAKAGYLETDKWAGLNWYRLTEKGIAACDAD